MLVPTITGSFRPKAVGEWLRLKACRDCLVLLGITQPRAIHKSLTRLALLGTTLYKYIAEDTFPKPVLLGDRCVGCVLGRPDRASQCHIKSGCAVVPQPVHGAGPGWPGASRRFLSPVVPTMSGHIGLREESCAGHLLAQRIAQLFRGPVLVAGTKLSSLGDKPCLRCVHGTYPVTIATNRFLGFGVCIGPLPVQCFMDRRSVCYSTGAGCAVNVSTSQRSRNGDAGCVVTSTEIDAFLRKWKGLLG